MSQIISGIFGGKPKPPKLIEQKKPVEKITQNIEKDKILREFSKRKRATLLSTGGGTANIRTQKLGAG